MPQRIRLMDTASWRELDAGWRDRLVWLHDDYYFRRQDALWKANALRTLPVRAGRRGVWGCAPRSMSPDKCINVLLPDTIGTTACRH